MSCKLKVVVSLLRRRNVFWVILFGPCSKTNPSVLGHNTCQTAKKTSNFLGPVSLKRFTVVNLILIKKYYVPCDEFLYH